jgi:hypothetical protein
MKKDALVWLFIVLIDFILILNVDSTFDNGDSILHYLQAHQALKTPHYYMDMWAKPLFILLAFPLASYGWIGMKIFNSACILFSAYGCKKIFDFYQLNGWYGVFLCFFSYSFFFVQSSGLTEPLFMVFLTWIVFFELKNKSYLSYSLLSFLPFIRSEGYIIIILFFAYSLFFKKKRFVPFLIIGTFVYGIFGLFYYNDFLWMFNQNPYSGIETKYGHGSSFHFIEQLPYVIGLPIFILFLVGIFHFVFKIKNNLYHKDHFLIYGITIGYITAHSIFWSFGLFHSFGLTRVLIVIIPLITLIAFRGLKWLENLVKNSFSKMIRFLVIALIIIFPFTNSPMAVSWEKDIEINNQQKLILKTNNWLINEKLDSNPMITNAYYLPFILDKIIDNKNEIIEMKLLNDSSFQVRKGSLIIWDSYFATTDSQVSQELIERKFKVKRLKEFKNEENYKVVVYQII